MSKKTKPRKKRYALSKHHARAHVREFVDFDYLDKLSKAELDFLEKFSREYYQATFKNTHRDLHNRQAARRDVYGANNARRRDMWNKFLRAGGDPIDLSYDEETEE